MTVSSSAEALRHLNTPVDLASLSGAKARTLIATDALAGIRARKLTPTKGTYFQASGSQSLGDEIRHDRTRVSAGKIFKEIDDCQVCALGACFAAQIARSPQISVGDAGFWLDTFGRVHTSSDSYLRDQLQQYFSPAQLGLIESAFEYDSQFMRKAIHHGERRLPTAEEDKQAAHAEEFGRKHLTAEARLVAILENIIDNCGEFKP